MIVFVITKYVASIYPISYYHLCICLYILDITQCLTIHSYQSSMFTTILVILIIEALSWLSRASSQCCRWARRVFWAADYSPSWTCCCCYSCYVHSVYSACPGDLFLLERCCCCLAMSYYLRFRGLSHPVDP